LTETATICEKCNGTGFVIIHKGDTEIARKCDCQIEDSYLKVAEKANIPPRFRGAGLEWGYQPDPNNPSQSKAKNIAMQFIQQYPAVEKGLLFQGAIGLGKTSILCSIGFALIKKGVDVFYVDWNDLVREMRTGEGHATRDFSVIHQLISRMAEVDLLLFDELGASRVSQWVYDNIYFLFNKRYNHNKITICASNFLDVPANGIETLSQRVGDRIRSRLYEMTLPVEIKGSDFRQRTLSGKNSVPGFH